MADPLKKVRSGERVEIPAETWNLLIDAARAQLGRSGTGGADPLTFDREQTKIFVRNNSGSTVLRFGILALTGVVISPSDNLDQFKEQATFKGDAPTGSTVAGLWCVALEPIRDGEIGLAAIDGIVPVQLSVPGSLGAFAIVQDADTTTLGTSDTGDARILWAEPSGSTRWALIRLGDASVAEGGGGSGLTVNYTGGTTVNIDNTSTIVNAGNTVYTPSSPSAWTGDQTDLDIGFATRIRISSDQHYRVLNSLVAVAGRMVCLHNVGSYVILIAHEHSGSTAANRIRTATGNTYWLAPGHEVTLWCDPTTSRWRVSESSDERLGGTATYALTADTADFALTRDATQHRITPDADGWTISGFTGGVAGLRHVIINGSDADSFTLLHSDVGSSAANRLFLPNGEDVVIPPRAACMIEWDDADDRWHLHYLGQVEPTLADGRIGYGSVTDKLTGTLDLYRESEAVLRIRGSTGSAQPILRTQRNIEGVDLADGDIVGQRIYEPYYDGGYVECFEETIKHWETEATDKIAWEVKVGSGAADKSVFKAGTNGKIIVSQAATVDRLVGTGSTHAELINIALASPYLVLSGSTLTAKCDLLSPLHDTEISVSSNTTATISRMHVLDGSGCTLTLPAVSGNTGKLLGIRIATSATGLMTIDGNSTELIDGEQTRIMWAGESAILLCNGTSWAKIAGKTIAMKCKCLNSKSLGSYDSIAHATVTVVPLDSTDHDNTGLMSDLANDRITCRRSGVYITSGFVGYCGSASAGGIGANATRLFASFPGAQPEVSAVSGSVPCIGAATTWSLTAGSHYQLTGYQTTGVTQYFGPGVSNFSLAEIPSW